MQAGKQHVQVIMPQMPPNLSGPAKHPSWGSVHVILADSSASWERRFPPKPLKHCGPFPRCPPQEEATQAMQGGQRSMLTHDWSQGERKMSRFSMLTSVLLFISAWRLRSLPSSHKANCTMELVHDIIFAGTHWPTHCTRPIGLLWTISRAISPQLAPPGSGE